MLASTHGVTSGHVWPAYMHGPVAPTLSFLQVILQDGEPGSVILTSVGSVAAGGLRVDCG